MRLVAGGVLVNDAARLLMAGPSAGVAVLYGLTIGLGLLLIVGLWTPFVGALIAIDALSMIALPPHPQRWILLASVGAGLALLGPGTWSLDARWFGWRRLEIRNGNKNHDAPP